MALKFAVNNSLSAVTSLPASISGGGLNLISTQTASSSATINFTSGIDSTYKEYIFKFINIHPASASFFEFNMSVDSGSNYNVTKTTTIFISAHKEDTDGTDFTYRTAQDLAQSTDYQKLLSYGDVGADNDQSLSGTLHLFNPSSTTFVKHFLARTSDSDATDYQIDSFIAGYGNTTSSVDAISFRMSSGNIDSGTIKMYGVT
tara:strand:+ start:1302 stop:1910 length:609 start_codon:yes stop_codon:yes gene_type:complete